MNNKYLMCAALVLLVCVFHYFNSVAIDDIEQRSSSLLVQDFGDVISETPSLTAEALAEIYGLEYVVEVDEEELQDEPEATIIYLDETQVAVKAISRIGDSYFVVVDYQQQGESVRKKLTLGDQLLGYNLVSINNYILNFEGKDEKSLSFRIFKKSQQ